MSWLGSIWDDITGKSAAKDASNAQVAMAQGGIDEQKRQFDAMRGLQQPYVEAGTQALGGYQNLLGLNGASAQQTAVDGINNSPLMQSMYAQGDNAILQNASATGGLRGGNTQEALADNRMNMLHQNILSQQQNLGGLMGIGQNASAGVGNAGINTGNNIANQMNGIGQAQAGYHMANGKINQGLLGSAIGLGAKAIGGGLLGRFF